MTSLPVSDQDLMEHAREAMKKAYAPYSQFQVGAAVLTEDGTIYEGHNIENASYGLSVCAERNAVFRAVFDGHRRMVAVAIASSAEGHVASSPCGACRQVLCEFATGDMRVILENGDTLVAYTLDDLLPHPFRPENLGIDPPWA